MYISLLGGQDLSSCRRLASCDCLVVVVSWALSFAEDPKALKLNSY